MTTTAMTTTLGGEVVDAGEQHIARAGATTRATNGIRGLSRRPRAT